jgi:hypothetical protein
MHITLTNFNGVVHTSLLSVSVSVFYTTIVARQRLGKNVTTATNIHETIKELFDASFSMLSLS